MRLRNQLLALIIFAGFLALGTFYIRYWTEKRPFGIILFVSDGMVSRHLTAARLYSGGADARLNLERHFGNVALVRNDGVQFSVPDAAAAATAIATGRKAKHRALSVDESGASLATILELAKAEGRNVGLVTTDRFTEPSTAAFFAHAQDSTLREPLAATLAGQTGMKVLLGGGMGDFIPADKGGFRTDQKNLLDGLGGPAWDVVRTKAELESAAPYRDGTLLGLFAPGALSSVKQREAGANPEPSLADMVRRAIQCLETDRDGYVLVIDETQITRAAMINDGEMLLRETAELDKAIETAVQYAGERSLIVAVGRSSTGGFALNGSPLRQDKGIALLGPTPEGKPAITWATGPNGKDSAQPSAHTAPAALGNAEDVIALGRGLGAEKIRGFIDSTAIFELLRGSL
jgi:alkaline phosphatase